MDNAQRITKKKYIISAIILMVAVIVFSFFASAYTNVYVAKVIISVPLYRDADFQSEIILEEIKENEILELVGAEFKTADGEVWQKVKYNDIYEGYIPYSYIYFTTNNEGYTVQVVKAKSRYAGEKINAYKYYDDKSEIAYTFSDGEKVNIIVEQSKNYGGYSKIIVMNDGKAEFAFIKTENLTAGLSYNQLLAVIIASGFAALLIIAGIIATAVVRNKRKN